MINQETKSIINGLFLFFISFLLTSCDSSSSSSSSSDDTSPKPSVANNIYFNDSLAYAYIDKQVSFGPRNPSSKGHSVCAQWILSELKKLSDTAYFQEFDAVTYDSKKHQGKNIIAKINPNQSHRILLCAHWDTRPIADHDASNPHSPILGANDAGSGVGVILAILDAFKKNSTPIGIDIVFFDLEDYGQPENSGLPPMENSWCLGSQYWSKNNGYTTLPRWGILLDMVGGSQATFLKEQSSVTYASNLLNRVWENAGKLNHSQYFLHEPMGQITDDHYYINTLAGIPTIDIIHYKKDNGGFADYWHTHNDNMTSVDRNTLKAVGQTVVLTIREEESFIQ